MPTLLMYKTMGGLIPADETQNEIYHDAKISPGELVKVNFVVGRKYRFLQKFHTLIRATFDMQDAYETVEQWRSVVTVGSGWCDFVEGKNGEMIAIPKSISYNNLPDEAEFQQLYQDVLTFICETYVDDTPGRIETILRFL